jgi:NAD(P) transhydrogenase subunit alpha
MSTNLEFGLYVLMLATFVGLEVIRKVSPLLHTPLMSLTNAISAISVVGAIVITGSSGATPLSKILGFIAITAAVTNIVSGFLITDRMLKMFKKPSSPPGAPLRATGLAGEKPSSPFAGEMPSNPLAGEKHEGKK